MENLKKAKQKQTKNMKKKNNFFEKG